MCGRKYRSNNTKRSIRPSRRDLQLSGKKNNQMQCNMCYNGESKKMPWIEISVLGMRVEVRVRGLVRKVSREDMTDQDFDIRRERDRSVFKLRQACERFGQK